jgi:membrane protein required for colicin V production
MGVTLFDLIAVLIVVVSALVGFTRGAVRELVTVFAFTVAAMASIYLLPFAAPLFEGVMKPDWVAKAAAVVAVFILAYIALRLGGGYLTSRLQSQAALGTVDRIIGLAFGVIRALVFLGVFYLVFNLATPPELVPRWIADGRLYPVARLSARVLQGVAPKSLAEGPLAPLESVVKADPGGESGPSAQTPRRNRARTAPGYDKRSRDDIDALIEKTR